MSIEIEIESWEGEYKVWHAIAKGFERDLNARAGSREDALADIEAQVAKTLASYQKANETRQVHKVMVIPEGAGVRVLKDDIEGDDET